MLVGKFEFYIKIKKKKKKKGKSMQTSSLRLGCFCRVYWRDNVGHSGDHALRFLCILIKAVEYEMTLYHAQPYTILNRMRLCKTVR